VNIAEKATVSTNKGKLEGIYQEGVYIFKGIPYAAAPTGNLRWMPPQPVKPWSGIRSARNYGAIAPQNIITGDSPGTPHFKDQAASGFLKAAIWPDAVTWYWLPLITVSVC